MARPLGPDLDTQLDDLDVRLDGLDTQSGADVARVGPYLGGRLARPRRGRLGSRLGASAALLALVVACGGSEEAPDAGPDLSPQSEEASPVAADGEGEAGSAPEGPDVELAPEAADGDVRVHRPADADAVAACDEVDGEDPGAVVRFPTAGTADAGAGPVTVEVLGCGSTPGASLRWEAYHGDDRRPTLEGEMTGGESGDWDSFSIVETYWTPGEWRVVVFGVEEGSPDRQEFDEVTFTVG